MMACTIDEAVRRMICVGGSLSHMGGVDNFCWPNIQYNSSNNPDGRFKAAQLVRACRALKVSCMAYGIPLLSGKDSMYVDGHLTGAYGDRVKVSAMETCQFSACGVIEDINHCITMDAKAAGDFVYVLGDTRNELGGSEYYEFMGQTGLNVPQVYHDKFKIIYKTLEKAMENELIASCRAVARGGLAVHLAQVAMAGGLGMEIDLSQVPMDSARGDLRDDRLLFSESAGRFIVTVSPLSRELFEKLFKGLACGMVGRVTEDHDRLKISGMAGKNLVDTKLEILENGWRGPLGDKI